ncbi:MAG: ABC transporter ATP-binding protein, partial [Propionibacteriaceae bacterium]|nr:ABC transporter ATP-binding protein [Propionibacteriaceae bacterium]
MTPGDRSGLRLEALTVGYQLGWGRTKEVVRDIDVTARPGELTALIGPNGTGKSTLLRTVAGLQKVLAGSISLDGHDLARMSAAERARHQSIVLTERVAPGRLTARELVGLGRHPHTGFDGRLTARDHRIVEESIAAVGATSLADRDLAELSDG